MFATKQSHIHPHRQRLGVPYLLGALVFLWPLTGYSQTQQPTPSSTRGTKTSAPVTDLTVSPQEEIQILDAIENPSNTLSAKSLPTPGTTPAQAPSTATSTPVTYAPPAAPTGLSVLILKEGVYLSWAAAPAGSPVTAYNVYRSTTPGGGYKPINNKPLAAPYFLDGAQNSLSPPQNGEDYFYVVAAGDSQGKTSPTSDEIAVTPQGMEIPLTEEQIAAAQKPTPSPTPEEEKVLVVPERNIVNLQLPADTQLSIQGYKKIEAQLSFQQFNRPSVNGIPSEVDTTLINQELVVSLQGKVGKNVDVNVDYSDVNRAGGVDQSKQDISIKYHGDENSPVQEVAFGDLQLLLPNTEFAGFSKQLFGLQAKLKFDQFRFTGFFAQTKGISETKVFKGNAVQVDKLVQDYTFIPFKYFLITRDSHPIVDPASGLVVNGALPVANSEKVWVDGGQGQINPIDPTLQQFNGPFEHWLPGRDYTIDYSTGIITFIRGLPSTARIAVAFTRRWDNASIGFSGSNIDLTPGNLKVPDSGVIDNGHHLIKDNNNTTGPSSPTAIALSPLYLVNYYDLGRDKIVPPQQDPDFLFQIIAQGNNNVLQTGQGVSQVGVSNPWVYNVNLDFNVLTVVNANFLAPGAPASFLWPERPFANQDTTGGSGTNDVYSQTTPPTSLYSVHLRYKTQLNFFQLGRFNIIRGSEAIYLDGRRLRRDVDYSFDYTSGFLDFLDKSILRPDSQVVVTYEYAPFGSFNQNNILGARAEYDLNDHFFIGSTFLESDAQQPLEVPQVGSTPNALSLLDADTRYDVSSEEIQSITGIIPGLENWKPPLSLHLSGEIAQSSFNPDTFNAEGEKGVAMIDNMEGIDSVTGTSMNQTSWLVSAAPQGVGFLGGAPYDAAPDAGNNRTRFYNSGAPNSNMMIFQTIGTQNTGSLNFTNVPAYGGHVYANTGQANDAVQVLQFPYSRLTNQRWAGVRQVISANGTDFSNVSYFQTWIYNDGNDKWIMVDFGVMNEDSNGNGVLDRDPNFGTSSQASVTYGIPTFYYPGNPWSSGGSSTAGINFLLPGEQTSQEGVSVGSGTNYVTEDMNGNNQLDNTDAYYEYGIRANWTGWRQVKVPVNFTATDNMASTPDGIPYFYHVQNPSLANPTIIRTVRLWTTGAAPSQTSGDFYVENISFSHNLWQLQVDPTANVNQGVTVNTAKFDVNSISKDQDSSYSPTLRFLTVQAGQDQSAILLKEKSLKISYNLSSADFEPSGNINGLPIYYATRIFSQGLDLTDYQNLRFDLQIKIIPRPGDTLFIRVGNDQQNYYQYNIQLTAAAVSCMNNWGTVNIPLDGSGGNRLKVGTPFVNRATNVSFGVLSPNPPSGNVGELWINNLRTANSAVRTGVARRANAAVVLGNNFATINTRYREVDSGFTQIDQTSTHFQHSTQVGADYSSSGVFLFSQPLVTQISITRQDLYTEDALGQNPYYLSLPKSRIDSTTGSIGYTKDLGPSFGRLTSVRLSGSTNAETDNYQPDYLNSQPGLQGNTHKGEEIGSLASTYDAPPKIFFLPLGANQFNGSYSLTHDTQGFDPPNYLNLAPYERTTRVQTYGWTNTTELVKNLVFTPGYTWTLTDAKGNTNSPGVPVSLVSYSPDYTKFQERYQPKAGLVYRGIPGFIPSVDYSGSNQYDYVSFIDGTRFNTANTLNYSANLTPGTWFDFLQKINLTVFGGRTESGTATIPAYNRVGALTLEQKWLTSPLTGPTSIPFGLLLNGSQSVAHQLNASFKLFDVWDFRPTGSWTDQLSLLAQGTNPVKQSGDTLGLTTIYNRKIFTLPLVMFSMDSAQFQYNHTDNIQYDSSTPPNVANQTNSDLFGVTLPYDIDQKAQGNIHFQRTVGFQNGLTTANIPVNQLDDQASIEYNQKFAPNQEFHIPFTHWKIQLQDAIEFKATFLMEFVNNGSPAQSSYAANNLQTARYRGTINLNYNALKNLRIGIGLANEYFYNTTYRITNSTPDHTQDYTLWQGNISAEARF